MYDNGQCSQRWPWYHIIRTTTAFRGLWPLTLKFDGSTLPFLKFDRRHCTTLKSTGTSKRNSDRGHCHFLKSTGDIALFQNRQEHFKNSHRGHCHFFKIDRRLWRHPIKGPGFVPNLTIGIIPNLEIITWEATLKTNMVDPVWAALWPGGQEGN